MTLQIAGHTHFLHERYFGRPSCPKCGELMIAPEYPEFTECLSGDGFVTFGLATAAQTGSTPW